MAKPELSVEQLIENKFYNSRTFSEEIEKIAKENKDMKYMDSIVFFCEKNNIDIESIPKLISKPLKEKLKAEAMELNLLKRTSHAKLPLSFLKWNPSIVTRVILDWKITSLNKIMTIIGTEENLVRL